MLMTILNASQDNLINPRESLLFVTKLMGFSKEEEYQVIKETYCIIPPEVTPYALLMLDNNIK